MIDPTDKARSIEGGSAKSRAHQPNLSENSSVIILDESGPSFESLPLI